MLAPRNDQSLRDLFGELLDRTKAYVRAEIALVKQTGATWTARAKPALVFLVAAVFILQAALTVLLAALGLALGDLLGPGGGMAVAGLVGAAIAGLLAWMGVSRLTRVAK